MSELDRTIHEPARLRILTILDGIDAADFNFLITALGLTKGNLSSHMDKLEKAGFVEVEKSFIGRTPHTNFHITPAGREALESYWRELDAIRQLQVARPERAVPPAGEADPGPTRA